MKKLIFAVAVFTSAFTLAGCFGPSREEILAEDDATCRSMGLKFGSPEFAQCRMLLLQQREANAAQARQNAVNTINGYRDNVMNNQVPASVYAPPHIAPIGR